MIVGLTGSFGSGKSTVAKILKSCGARIIDADAISHRVIRRGSLVYEKILKIFGSSILGKNGQIDRRKLAKIVFNDKPLLLRLNRAVQPPVVKIIRQELTAKKGILVLDAPLLIEAGLLRVVDKLIVVKINKKTQIARLMSHKKISRSDIIKRINAQMDLGKKVRLADFIIDNNGNIAYTKKQAKLIWKKLRLEEEQWKS